MNDDDRHLLMRTRDGHEREARELWARHAPALLALASAVLGPGEAPDAVQSAFCRVLQADRATVRAVRDVRAWLVGLTRHVALNQRRESRRRAARQARACVRASRDAAAPARDAGDALDAALWSLPRRWREVVILRHVGGMTFEQVAAAMGRSRSTIADWHAAAMDRLRERVAPDAEPRAPAGAGGAERSAGRARAADEPAGAVAGREVRCG